VHEAREALLAKKLRLAVAELTDVGRKRERNQDNVAHQIPSDDETLQRRGALLIVCDGMGGHAAGEVASQLAIDTIRNTYYNAHHHDIISALAHAVEQANAAIFGHAREHNELAGMGTTCVACVLAGGRAYVVNVGDSRAYLVRHGKMRQVTQDHSWVAEQVRAGLLSEEQARHHSHRNVITRSLGTQPSVTADLFIENMHDGDRMLLCSDGLHGYVDEREIEREMVAEQRPEDAAHTLIAMANANGGPDNITALVVNLLEVPEITEELVLPPSIAGAADAAKSAADTATHPLPIVTGPVPAVTAPAASTRKRKRSGARRMTWAVVQIAALLVLGTGIWAYVFGPFAASRSATHDVSADLTQANAAVAEAPSGDPVKALADLSAARKQLMADLTAPNVTASQKQQINKLLSDDLVKAIKTALANYGTEAKIQSIAPGAVVSYADSSSVCAPPGATSNQPLQQVAAMFSDPTTGPKVGNASGSRVLYVLNDGFVYELITPVDTSLAPTAGPLACTRVGLPASFTSTIGIAVDGQTLDMLSRRADGSYAVVNVPATGFNPDGSIVFGNSTSFNVPTPQNERPTHLAAQGGTYYVSFEQNSGADAGAWIFSGDTSKGPAKTVNLPPVVTSMAISGGTLYLLLIDGRIGHLDSTPTFVADSVNAPAPLQGDPASYAIATPVPQPNGAASSGRFSDTATLAVDPGTSGRVLVDDATTSRVVRFQLGSGGSGIGPSLAAQYVYSAPLQDLSPLAGASANNKLFLYLWSQDHLVAIPAPDL
jgi:serine/threonine protein phosphatase PrpC